MDRAQYLFFIGCYFTLEGLIETFFLSNCTEFSELVRTGDLDFYLLKPIDEQFLVTCRNIDWSTAPNAIMGLGVMLFACATWTGPSIRSRSDYSPVSSSVGWPSRTVFCSY